jgi:hypothetical protein
MTEPSNREPDANERLWRGLFFWLSAVMGAFALVDLESGRPANAIGDAGVACLMLSLMNQFPVVKAIIGAASRKATPAQLQREAERTRRDHPWAERVATTGWTLLFGSLLLRALGFD